MKSASCGKAKKGDVLITVSRIETEEVVINIRSKVKELYAHEIEKTVREIVSQAGKTNLEITVDDYGALDFALRARLITALQRLQEKGDDTDVLA